MNRIELERKLIESRERLLENFGELSDEELRRPRTPSEHDSNNQWSALDHLVHLALIERNFNAIIRQHFTGNANPVDLLNDEQGRARTPEQFMATVHEWNEEWQREHHHDTFSKVVAITAFARGETLQLMSELTDCQLEERLPQAPWADGTVLGVFGINADHADTHLRWVENSGGIAQ